MWEKEFLKLTKKVRTPLNHFTKVSCKFPILYILILPILINCIYLFSIDDNSHLKSSVFFN